MNNEHTSYPASCREAEKSSTAGMTLAQRILHVGGRNNAAGYVEFGSTQAVNALIQQYLRDHTALLRANAAVVPDGWKLIAVNQGFDDLMYWLDRCDSKGHLENCSDLIEPWSTFQYRDVPEAAPSAPVLAEPQKVRWEICKHCGHDVKEPCHHNANPNAAKNCHWNQERTRVLGTGLVNNRPTQQPVQGGGDALVQALRAALTSAEVPALYRVAIIGYFCNELNALALPPAQPAPQAQGEGRLVATLRTDAKGGRAATVFELDEAADLIERAYVTPPSPVAQPEALPVQGIEYWRDEYDRSVSEHEACKAECDRLRDELAARASLPTSGVQKPFVYMNDAFVNDMREGERILMAAVVSSPGGRYNTPLYRAPQPAAERAGLSVARIKSLGPRGTEDEAIRWTRIVEAAHGIASPQAGGGEKA